MNSPTCITNTDQCDFVGTDCCFQEPSGPPCWAMPPMAGMKDGIAIMTGGGIGEPFCDDFYNDFYGDVEEMRMYCGSGSRGLFVEGFTTRYGPKLGSNMFAWTQVHGGSQQDSQV